MKKFVKSKINYDVICQILQLHLNLYNVLSGITDQQKIWDVFLKIIVFKVTKTLHPKHHNPINSTK